MASHRSRLPAPCIAALLLLLLAAVISSEASSTVLQAHLEPADEAGYRTYIVLLQAPVQRMDADAHRAWHKSFLPSLRTSLGEPRLRRSYSTLLHGFSARLTEEEVERVSAKPGFVRAFPNFVRYLQTTRTPAFLGLPYHMGQSPLDWIGFGGLRMIIGVVDGGIANSHPSMDDGGFDEPPQRWRGSCDNGIKCNKKLIGAKNLVDNGPPLDVTDGHGTHVASIAAGNFVAGANFNGLATGNASGMAPQAHVAVYKACNNDGRCTDEAIMSAIIAAVDDGVDVISVSIGGTSQPYDHDPVAVASFAAMRANILVVASAGNDGPTASTVHNDVPWLMTVGAGTVDRSLMANVITDDEHLTVVFGQSLANRQLLARVRDRPEVTHDLLYDGGHPNCEYPEDEMPVRVPGRLVICQAGREMSSETFSTLLSFNASAIVMVDPQVGGYTEPLYYLGDRPILQVPYNDGGFLKAYSSSPHPRAAVDFTAGTIVGATLAPTVAFSSSRGPSRYPGIVKPDVLAPGVNILGGIPYQAGDGGAVYYGIKSGTSMAVPHVSGAAILLKRLHRSWSPAAIKSALMTTADIIDNSGHRILDEQRNPAGAYAMGAGHINVSSAMDPGLVYNLTQWQYASHVCSTLGQAGLRVFFPEPNSWRCSDLPSTHPANLNYPMITVPLQPTGFTVTRSLTNVAPLGTPETYTVRTDMPPEVSVTVDPSRLTFSNPGEMHFYQITVSTNIFPVQRGLYEGTVEWSSSKHRVRSPMLAIMN